MDKHVIDNELSNLFQKENVGNSLDDFDVLQTLGKGSYGFVAKVKSRKNQKIYAMKMIDFSLVNDKQEIELLMNEIQIIQKLDSPHIVKYYSYFKIENRLYIIMEYINNGDIKGYIQANLSMKKVIPENEIWELMYQCMSGLCYIHNNKLIHRDIKPANLFLTDDKTVKIGDFGVSAERKKDFNKFKNNATQSKLEKETIMIGTPLYMSPEIFAHKPYGHKVDVYSMGCTFYELCHFSAPRLPLPGITPGGEIVTTLQEIPPKCNKGAYSQNLETLIQKMINKDENERPSSQEVFSLIRNQYNSLRIQNTSIFSVYRCLIGYQNLYNKLIKHCCQNIALQNFPITYTFDLALKNITNPMSNSIIQIIQQIRELLTYNNGEFIDPGEIDCIDLIKYIIATLFKETNRNPNCKIPYLYSEDNDIDIFNRENIMKKYLLNFQNCFKSFVSNFFFGTFEIFRQCLVCNKQRTYFENFYYLSINITQAIKYGSNLNDQAFIQNCLQFEPIINIFRYCPACNNMTNHQEKKHIFTMPLNLIIHLKSEDTFNSNQNISFPFTLMMPDNQNYSLVGVIQKYIENGEKRYCATFPFNQTWVVSNGYNLRMNTDSPQNYKCGNVVMLFYSNPGQ